jgi:hypothetical protein
MESIIDGEAIEKENLIAICNNTIQFIKFTNDYAKRL